MEVSAQCVRGFGIVSFNAVELLLLMFWWVGRAIAHEISGKHYLLAFFPRESTTLYASSIQ